MKRIFFLFTFLCAWTQLSATALTPEVLADLKQRAMNGEANALYALGEIYENGNGVAADKNRALAYYISAARAEHPQAKERARLLGDAAKHGGLGKAYTVNFGNDNKMEFLPVPAGTFKMGSPYNEPGRSEDEAQTLVEISTFMLARTEVTQAQWVAIMGKNPSSHKGNNLPVTQVSWYDAMRFCEKLTEWGRREGRLPKHVKFTLPTEAQWEYACRAGSEKAFYAGDSEGALSRIAWWVGNARYKTHPCGQKRANAWGLCDMLGNAKEWCLDRYATTLPGGKDPVVERGSNCIIRGGGWGNTADGCRAAIRYNYPPDFRNSDLGFRVALIQDGSN